MIQLQESGVTFKNAYCDSPLCVPSRAALLSGNFDRQSLYLREPINIVPLVMVHYRILGRKNNVIEAWNNFKGLDPSFRNWTIDFQEAGYNLGIYGKMDDKASFKIFAFPFC